ncbi:hypothetical protein Barb7_03135 [Bacteroidales bacterium Barb7]|nr:hypothetical protein Barb7_03135 [Bacteroidales bacterium Barb7]
MLTALAFIPIVFKVIFRDVRFSFFTAISASIPVSYPSSVQMRLYAPAGISGIE